MPDFKTIADFRMDNGEVIRKVCRAFVLLCRHRDLLSDATVAIDGSKFTAVDARDRNFTEAKMKRRLAHASIARYLSQLDTADRQGPMVPEAKTTRLKEKIATLGEEIERLNALNARVTIGVNVEPANVIPHDDENVGFLIPRCAAPLAIATATHSAIYIDAS